MDKAKKTKKQRKHDRNKDTCKAYASTFQRERNKLNKLLKVVECNPNDKGAIAAVERLKLTLGVR